MDLLLSAPEAAEAESLYGRTALKEELRRAIGEGALETDELVSRAKEALARRFAPTLRRAINGTGILLHTNLGRAPLSETAREALARVAMNEDTAMSEACTETRWQRSPQARRTKEQP